MSNDENEKLGFRNDPSVFSDQAHRFIDGQVV
jgi:hypothetical protein